nr:hypothetical protein [bacterium]
MRKVQILLSFLFLAIFIIIPQNMFATNYEIYDFVAENTAECGSSISSNDSGLVGVFRVEIRSFGANGSATITSVIIENKGSVGKNNIDTVTVRYERIEGTGNADYNGNETLIATRPGSDFSAQNTMTINLNLSCGGSATDFYLYVVYHLKNANIGDTADVSCPAYGLTFNYVGGMLPYDNEALGLEPDVEINSPNSRLVVSPIRNWYVSTSGNDATGDGTIGNPYQTITKAMSVVSAGDT